MSETTEKENLNQPWREWMAREIAAREEAESDPAKKAEQEKLRVEYYATRANNNGGPDFVEIIDGIRYRSNQSPNNAAG